MDSADNKQLVRQLYAELSKGNTKPFIDCLAEDIRWTVIGTTKFSGTIEGKQNVVNKLFNRVAAQLDGPTKTTIKNLIAEGEYVVVESSGRVVTTAGKPYYNTYCEIFRLAGGEVKEVTVYLDTALINAVFGAGATGD
jgi:ketosteroid isomerase-like protein